MDLSENLRISLLNLVFAMIYIIHKMLKVVKIHLHFLKDNILECFFKKYNRLLFFLKKIIFIEYLEILKIFSSMRKKKNKSVRVNNFWSKNYIKYESNGDRSKTL